MVLLQGSGRRERGEGGSHRAIDLRRAVLYRWHRKPDTIAHYSAAHDRSAQEVGPGFTARQMHATALAARKTVAGDFLLAALIQGYDFDA